MLNRLTLVFCCLAAVLAQARFSRADTQPAKVVAGCVVNVSAFGAKGDGKTDDTAVIQKAIDVVSKRGGGIVRLARGNYRIASHIVVRDNVTLEGVWTVPTAWSQFKGSTLLAEEGQGRKDGPAFITLCLNATLKGLTIFYPNQRMDKIVPYPWCIAGSGADNPSIIDVLMVNPYQGVDFATRNSGRHFIRNLYGQPLCTGIQVDKCYDVGRIENVHFWPFWTWDQKTAVPEFMRKHGEAFIFGRTDWQYVLNTFCFGYKVGYRFIQTRAGACNGNFLGIGADATNTAVLIEQSQKIGLLITNGEFVSFQEPNPTEVVVKDSNTGVAQFSNCAFWGPSERVADIAGSGAVSFAQCHFVFWDRKNEGQYAIRCRRGELTVSGCRFARPSPGVWLGRKVTAAAVFGNFFAHRRQVTNESDGDVQVGLNVSSCRPFTVGKNAVGIDDSDGPPAFTTRGTWRVTHDPKSMNGSLVWAEKGKGEATATWSATVPRTGAYAVFVFCGPDPNHDHAKNAKYSVRYPGGEKAITIDQSVQDGEWRFLGAFPFKEGDNVSVTLSNDADGNVIADAVKFLLRKDIR